eukprot:332814-Prymnesium_polylepis.1
MRNHAGVAWGAARVSWETGCLCVRGGGRVLIFLFSRWAAALVAGHADSARCEPMCLRVEACRMNVSPLVVRSARAHLTVSHRLRAAPAPSAAPCHRLAARAFTHSPAPTAALPVCAQSRPRDDPGAP